MRRRGNISLKLLTQMMSKAGFDHVITIDLHSKESLGFFDCKIDNLRASPFLIQYIQEGVSDSLTNLHSFRRQNVLPQRSHRVQTDGQVVSEVWLDTSHHHGFASERNSGAFSD